MNKPRDHRSPALDVRSQNETAAVGAQDEHGREGSLNSGKQLKKTGRVSSDDAEMSSAGAKSDSPQSSKKAESPEKKTQPLGRLAREET